MSKFKEIEIIFNNNSDKQFFAQNELFNIINYFTPLADNLQKSKINPELLTPEKIRITLSLFGYKKNLFLSKYLCYIKSSKNTDYSEIIDYFDSFIAFCFDLDLDSVISGNLKFEYKKFI